MDENRNREELEAWLESRENEEAVVIAVRAAQRVLPLGTGVFRSKMDSPRWRFMLPVFRALVNARVAPSEPISTFEVAALASAARSAARAADIALRSAARAAAISADSAAFSASARCSSPQTAGISAHAASLSANAVAADAAAPYAKYVDPTISASHADPVRSAVWGVIWKDVKSLGGQGSLAALAKQPLWHGNPPDWFAENWADLKANLLLAGDENWLVWIDWYEARLRGDPINEDLERAKVMIPDDIWDQGPKVVNAEIRQLIDDVIS